MVDASHIKEMMEVKSADGKHIGVVDSKEGDRLKLAAGGMHHYIDIENVEAVEDGKVRLNTTAEETMATWH